MFPTCGDITSAFGAFDRLQSVDINQVIINMLLDYERKTYSKRNLLPNIWKIHIETFFSLVPSVHEHKLPSITGRRWCNMKIWKIANFRDSQLPLMIQFPVWLEVIVSISFNINQTKYSLTFLTTKHQLLHPGRKF